MTTAVVIVNRSSGARFSERRLRKALARLAGSPKVAVVYPKTRDEAIDEAYRACKGGVTEIYVWGGDGSLNAAVNGVMTARSEGCDAPSIGVLGGGSGSDFLRTLRLHSTIERKITVDVGFVEIRDTGSVRYFINGLSCGVTAQIAKLKDSMPRFMPGFFKYLAATFLRLVQGKLYVSVAINDKERAGVLSLMLLNGQFVGGGMRILAKSSLDDGLLESVLIPKLSVSQIIRALVSVYTGGFTNSLQSKIEQFGAPLKISFAKGSYFETDGEIFMAQDVVVSIHAKALEVWYLK